MILSFANFHDFIRSQDGLSADAVEWQLILFPEYAAQRNKINLLPLHTALAIGCPASVVSVILKFNPDAARELVDARLFVSSYEGYDTWTALHLAIGRSAGEEIIQCLLDVWPEGARVRSGIKGFLPLHLAARQNSNETVVRLLLDAAPGAVKELSSDGDKWLPLHYALRFNASAEIVGMLVDAWPESARVASFTLGELPLHIAAQNSRDVRIVNLLLAAAPESIRAWSRDEEPCLPLHYAAGFIPSEDVFAALLEAWPQGALVRSKKRGLMPLHGAVRKTGNINVVKMLLAAAPEAVKVMSNDSNSWLPLHYAVRCSEDIDMVRTVLEAWPAAIHVRGGKYGDTALHE